MTDVIPAIIPNTFQTLKSEMEEVKELVPRVQVDIIDGSFAPEPTWPYNEGRETHRFAEISDGKRGFPHWKYLQFEIDLMVTRPELVVDDWIATGASAIIIHADSTEKHKQIFQTLKSYGVEIGLALLPKNDTQLVDEFREQVDFVQLMGNNKIGYHGVDLDPAVYRKLETLRKKYQELPLGVDIGVDFDTAPQLTQAGATRLVSGSAIFASDDKQAAVATLQSAGGR